MKNSEASGPTNRLKVLGIRSMIVSPDAPRCAPPTGRERHQGPIATVSSRASPSPLSQRACPGPSRSTTSVVTTAVMLLTPASSVCIASHRKLAMISPAKPGGQLVGQEVREQLVAGSVDRRLARGQQDGCSR